jgi:hypothetical protein
MGEPNRPRRVGASPDSFFWERLNQAAEPFFLPRSSTDCEEPRADVEPAGEVAATFLVARRYGLLPARLGASAVTNAATSRICRSLSFPLNDGIAIPPRVTFSTVHR